MAKKRDSGIELLRVIAIFMVIGVHTFLYGGFYEEAKEVGGLVYWMAGFLRMMFRPAVNIFVIITGYFMVRARFDLRRSYKRVVHVYMSVWFYSVVLGIITLIAGPVFYTIDGVTTPVHIIILKMIFPVMSQNWYFISDYILLCLFAPFVNITLQKISRRQYQVLLLITTLVMSVWFTIADMNLFDEVVRTYGYGDMEDGKNVFSFIYIYMIGGYIGLHVDKNEHVKYRYLIAVPVCAIVNCLLAYKLEPLGLSNAAMRYTNPFVILMAVFALMFFKDLHFYSKAVNLVASATIGVYAIHEFKYIRAALWKMFDFSKLNCSNVFFDMVYIIGVIMIIFIICTVIELLRQRLFGLCARLIRDRVGDN